jgi:alanine racemase
MSTIWDFEAGISLMRWKKLEKVIRPTIGILTNIGSSHDEGFVDLENKIKKKLILFKDVEILIYQKGSYR